MRGHDDIVNQLSLQKGDAGELVLEDGRRVWPVRCFPLSDPMGPVSLCDEDGHEVLFIPRLEEVREGTRTIIEDALASLEFLPVITRILSVNPPNSEPNIWEVETDRGATSFTLPTDTNVRRLSSYDLLLVDAHGLRYRIPDVRALDRRSRGYLVPYL